MIRVEALGGLRVFKDGEELESLPGKHVRAALLTYLAVERETNREKACSLLWPDSSPERARRSLSQTLYELRKELGEEWVESAGERLSVTDQLTADVSEMKAAVSEGRKADAVGLYGGPFLEGTSLGGGVDFEHWAENKRSDLHITVKRLLRSVVTSVEDLSERARLARKWVRLDPLDDEAQHALVECLALAGDRAAALEQYRVYAELIATELDVEPLDHTVELVERIKAGRLDFVDATPASDERSHGAGDTVRDEAAPPDLGPGLVVSRLIGRGATGAVYLARQPALKRLVAVKVLDAELANHPTARARFEREAQSAARISHPNVAPVYSVGATAAGRPYLVMPYVKGGTLADRMKALGPLPPDDVRAILSDAASALAAAHAVGVVHRDVRPANFLYSERDGRIYLADFGIAGVLESGTAEILKLTLTGELLGNIEYISPEQADGDEVDDRSDVYSLGILGRALLFGDARATAGVDACPDEELIEILDRATSKEARHRPSAAELGVALGRAKALGARDGPGLLGRIFKRSGS
ncbi:MAG: protein kinase [Gemmatimonadota bacterium]|jgi:DNA-binding SARP family transcriptional activator/tRNA A-37 threonylcarbamoyl transferase component Bud32